MSASISPTRAPCCASATARFVATVVFPTPPLPLETAMMVPRFGSGTGVGADGRGAAGLVSMTGSARFDDAAGRCGVAPGASASRTSTRTSVTPSTRSSAWRTSRASAGSSPALSRSVKRTRPAVDVATSRILSASRMFIPLRGSVIRASVASMRSWNVAIARNLPGGPTAAEEALRFAHHAIPDFVERTRDQRARRLHVAAAAEAAREAIHVDVAGAAEGDLHLAISEVAEEERHARSGDRARVLDDSIEILGANAVSLERAGAHRQPRDATPLVHTEARQHLGQQPYTTCGRGSVDPLVHLLRVDAMREQIGGDGVASRRGVAVAEAAGIGEDRRVQRARDLRRNLELELAREIVDELSGGARRRVREDDVPSRIIGRDVVVDDDLGNR